jgi:hypothetical protein
VHIRHRWGDARVEAEEHEVMYCEAQPMRMMYRTRAPSLIAVLLSILHCANTIRRRKSSASDGCKAAASCATPSADERSGGAVDCWSV